MSSNRNHHIFQMAFVGIILWRALYRWIYEIMVSGLIPGIY